MGEAAVKRPGELMIQPDSRHSANSPAGQSRACLRHVHGPIRSRPFSAFQRIAQTRGTPACSKVWRAEKKSRALHVRGRQSCGSVPLTSTARAWRKRGPRFLAVQSSPLDYLRNRVERYRPVRVPGLPPLVAGAIGYFAYRHGAPDRAHSRHGSRRRWQWTMR